MPRSFKPQIVGSSPTALTQNTQNMALSFMGRTRLFQGRKASSSLARAFTQTIKDTAPTFSGQAVTFSKWGRGFNSRWGFINGMTSGAIGSAAPFEGVGSRFDSWLVNRQDKTPRCSEVG